MRNIQKNKIRIYWLARFCKKKPSTTNNDNYAINSCASYAIKLFSFITIASQIIFTAIIDVKNDRLIGTTNSQCSGISVLLTPEFEAIRLNIYRAKIEDSLIDGGLGYFDNEFVFCEDGIQLKITSNQSIDMSNLANGEYAKKRNYIYFSASDNTDPNFSNHIYSYLRPIYTIRVLKKPFKKEIGNAYLADVKGLLGDSNENPTNSKFILFEDNIALGPAHAIHESIRTIGHGRYSHWLRAIYFSSSDNSDPNKNNRNYYLFEKLE